MQNKFYDKAKPLDALREEKHPSEGQIAEVIDALKDESLTRYFFYKLDNPAWVVPLKEKGVFHSPPEPIKLAKGLIRYPSWEAGVYLARVAQDCPNDVVEIIEKLSSTENISAQTNLINAVLKIPATYSIKTLPTLIKWLEQECNFYLYHRASKLVMKLAKQEEWKPATKLLLVLLGLSKEKYEIQEILKELVKNAQGPQTFNALELCEKLIAKIIMASKKDGSSYIWRPSIEDHQQNIAYYETRDTLISCTRDILKKCVEEDANETRLKLKKYLEDKRTIYWRFAINTITRHRDKFKDLIYPILMDKKYLYEIEVHHEYFELMKMEFPLLSEDEREKLVQLIKLGPKEEKDKGCKERWIRDLLWIVKKYLDTRTKKELDEIVDSYEEPEHPEFLTYMRSWVGPESPRTKEELEEFTAEQLIDYITTWKPKEKHFAPSPEGLARELEAVVGEDPVKYVEKIDSFLDDNVRPVYSFYLLFGLRSAIAKGNEFPWEPVLSFCDKIIQKEGNGLQKDEEEEERVNYDNVRLAVANLLQDAVTGKKSFLPIELMPRVRDIILSPKLINSPQPTQEYEADSNPIDLSINTVRGVAMHALIDYAWKRAWLIKEAEDENNTDKLNILNAETGRLEKKIKTVLKEKLDRGIEQTLTIHAIYGRYFPQLHYIDKAWVTELVPSIFPDPNSSTEKAHRDIAWKAYILFNPLYNEMYDVLKAQYITAVKELNTEETKKSDELSRQLAVHFMAAYLRGFESLEDKESLLNKFIANASGELRSSCVWSLKSVLDQEEGEKLLADWQKLKKYWENRLKIASRANKPEGFRHEIGAFTFWLNSIPKESSSIFLLVEQTAEFVQDSTDISNLIDYLCQKSEEHPFESAKILRALVNESTVMSLEHETMPIEKVLTNLIRSGGEPKNIAISLIHRFGELGIFEFKELL